MDANDRTTSATTERKGLSWRATFLIKFWPALIWILAFLVVLLANLYGCTISARGPEECRVLGVDIGGALYPLWALGYYLVLVVFWVPVGVMIVAISSNLLRKG
jgi:hypothetical protein